MSECKTLERMLVDYADGALDHQVTADVEAHLEKCAACRRVVEQYRETLTSVVAGVGEPPSGVAPAATGIRQRATQLQRHRRQAVRSAAACVTIACICFFLWSPDLDVGEVPIDPEIAALQERIAALEQDLADLRVAMESVSATEYRVANPHEEVAAMMFAAGLHYEEDRGNVVTALSRYRSVITSFPDTDAAIRAQERIDTLSGPAI